MIKKSRLDLYLLKSGLCETRQKAQGLILAARLEISMEKYGINLDNKY